MALLEAVRGTPSGKGLSTASYCIEVSARRYSRRAYLDVTTGM